MGSRLGQKLRRATKVAIAIALALAGLIGVSIFLSGLVRAPKPFPGYTLVAPVLSTETHLIDMQGRVVQSWKSDCTAGEVACLLENGHLLRAGQLSATERLFGCPQAGGRVQEFTWDGELIWDFKFHDEKRIPHHDIAKLPNGNVLLIVWEIKTGEETIAAGRRPESVDGSWLADSIIEIKPTGKQTGQIVWEWHVWDHLIQDHDASKANYGDVAAHPELIDINFGQTLLAEVSGARSLSDKDFESKKHLSTLQSIGYLGSPAARGSSGILPDWTHVNAVAYNAELDQIMLTVRAFSEFWIIDHSTTSAGARGHTEGRSGMGGDLLYRWGNLQAYRAGTERDQWLFSPHSALWIARDCPGTGHALVFNNGHGRLGSDYSSVDEVILPPVDDRGRYFRNTGTAWGPAKPVWSYTALNKTDFSAGLLSSAQRLPNGNTLICDGVSGRIFEVTASKNVVWQQLSPKIVAPAPSASDVQVGARETASRRHEILAPPVKDSLNLSPEQKRKLDDLQHQVDARLDEVLTEAQKRRLREIDAGGSRGFGGLAAPGQVMAMSRQMMLEPSDQQKSEFATLQKAVDAKLAQVLTVDQKAQLEKRIRDFVRGGPAQSGGGASKAPARQPALPPGVNPVFRATRYPADYAGLAGRDLRPAEH
jgi:hypothetical protein